MRRIPLVVLLAGLVSLAAAPQAAPPAGTESIRVMPLPRDGQVYVSFELAGGVTEEFRETIRSGLQTSFAYDFELRRGVPLWVDRTIAIATVVATVQFDNLTRRHQLSRLIDGRVEDALVTENQAEVDRWLTKFDRVPLFRTTELEPNAEYLRPRARPGAAAQHVVAAAVGPHGRVGARAIHLPSLTRRSRLRPSARPAGRLTACRCPRDSPWP